MTNNPPANSTQPDTRADWRRWLRENYQRTEGIWLVNFKKSSGQQQFDFDEAIEEALCFGWIDSKPRKLDDQRTMLWFAPRKPKSGWSKLNKDRVRRLIASGAMQPPGHEKIEQAKKDGSWNSLDAVESLTLPPDLKEAFQQHAGSRENFEAFPRSAKRGILEWISSAKKPETRARRVNETAQLAAQNERANQWRSKRAK